MFKDKIIKIYKLNLFNRCDDNGCVYYFSEKDFDGIQSKEYSFSSSKGHLLKGKFYYYENYKPNHIVIFDHGMGGGHLSYFKEIELLAKHGYLVYSYDHTGCMNSEGENTNGFGQSLCDLNDCINSFKNNSEYNNFTFSVIGHSWGAFSTMNIPYFHNDIKHVIAISGFISVKQILKQTFKGILSCVYDDVLNIEKQSNAKLINIDACETLQKYNGKALLIYSKDDKIVNYKYHYNILLDNLYNKHNISFLLTNKKGHNPNYTVEAVKYKDKFFKTYTKLLKKNKLNTIEEKENFINSYDWNQMTTQDMTVWNKIFLVLDNE